MNKLPGVDSVGTNMLSQLSSKISELAVNLCNRSLSIQLYHTLHIKETKNKSYNPDSGLMI